VKRLLWPLLLAGALLGAIAQLGAAQGIGPFLHSDKVSEYGGGAALNLIARGPWGAKPWRRPVVRFLEVQAISLTYEKLLDWNGFQSRDVRERMYGYLIAEGVIELGRLVIHRH